MEQQEKPDWRLLAKCKGLTKTYYSNGPVDEIVAKAKCRICPVKNACLSEALLRREREGIWGGMNERERRKLVAHIRVLGDIEVLAEGPATEAASTS